MSSPQRPTTPRPLRHRRRLHRSSGAYSVSQSPKAHYPVDPDHLPLEAPENAKRFEQLLDALDQLDLNMIDLQSIDHAVSQGFNELFSSFLYGIMITMWCNDFQTCPTQDEWENNRNGDGLDHRIADLEDSLRQARKKNSTLKARVDAENRKLASGARRPAGGAIKGGIPLKTPSIRRPIPTNSRQIDSSTDSFVVHPKSRIPQPRARAGPNLNQAPRYLRGLFDKLGSSVTKPKG